MEFNPEKLQPNLLRVIAFNQIAIMEAISGRPITLDKYEELMRRIQVTKDCLELTK